MSLLLRTEPPADYPGAWPTAAGQETPDNQPPEWLPGVSRFPTDTWVFYAPQCRGRWEPDSWALGFGPIDSESTRWSLFHCVGEDLYDSRAVCPQFDPSARYLLRWIAPFVGHDSAALLLGSVGSCRHFYRQYFDERPDLRRR